MSSAKLCCKASLVARNPAPQPTFHASPAAPGIGNKNNWQSELHHLHAHCQAMERLQGRKQTQWASPLLALRRTTVGLLVALKLAQSSTCIDSSTSPACNWQAKASLLTLFVAMVLGELTNSLQLLSPAQPVRKVCPSRQKLVAAWPQWWLEAATLCKAQHVSTDQRAGAACLGPTCVREVKPLDVH